MSTATAPVLTVRQLEVLRLAANGYTSSQIAARLGRSADAVNRRFLDAGRALGARSRTHAVALAIARGFVRLDEVEARTPAAVARDAA